MVLAESMFQSKVLGTMHVRLCAHTNCLYSIQFNYSVNVKWRSSAHRCRKAPLAVLLWQLERNSVSSATQGQTHLCACQATQWTPVGRKNRIIPTGFGIWVLFSFFNHNLLCCVKPSTGGASILLSNKWKNVKITEWVSSSQAIFMFFLIIF